MTREHKSETARRLVAGMSALITNGGLTLKCGEGGLGIFAQTAENILAEMAAEAPILAGAFTDSGTLSDELRLKRASQLYALACMLAIAAPHVTPDGATAEAWSASVRRLKDAYGQVFVAAGGRMSEIAT